MPGRSIVWASRWKRFLTLFVALVSAFPAAFQAAGPEYWDTYGFVEPYAGLRSEASGDFSDTWIGGVRLGRVGWLTGWEGDLSLAEGRAETGNRYQISLDGFLKPVETRHSSVLVLVGLGVTRLRGDPDLDEGFRFHYRYGLAYRARFSERMGLRLDVTGLRGGAGDFSSREATLGWVIYF